MDSSVPRQVNRPTARRSGKPLGKADARPEGRIWLDAPTGITQESGKLSFLHVGNELINFMLEFEDGSFVLMELFHSAKAALRKAGGDS